MTGPTEGPAKGPPRWPFARPSDWPPPWRVTGRDLAAAGVGAVVIVLVLGILGSLTGGEDMGAASQPSDVVTEVDVPPPPVLEPSTESGAGADPDEDGDEDGDEVSSSPGASEGMSVDGGEPEEAAPLADAAPAGEGALPDTARVTCPSATQTVSTADELAQAISSPSPGETIELEPGQYVGEFATTASGTAKDPIFLCGPKDAVLDGGDIEGGYVLHLDGASHWRLVGFTVTNGQKGVMADRTVGSVIQELTVTTIGDEAIHLRNQSTDNLVINNTISDTGRRRDKYGEGVYIGTAVSNWCTYTRCLADRSDRNVVKDNTISDVTSEGVDAKEGTTGGVITGNTFDGSALSGADSWVDVKGNNWLISDNVGVNATEDGFQTHEILRGWGDRNVFAGNDATVNGPGHAISSWPPGENVVRCDNTFSAAGEGLSNITCT